MVSAVRQSSVPPGNSPNSKSRQASVEPSSTSDGVAAVARARSVSVEPESLTTPKASKALSPAPECIREESVEPSSSSEVPPPDVIDTETFQQILELDEEDSRDFSRGMVWAYFAQAATTFNDMDKALKSEDLAKLSRLGHFLKGSSAALGVQKVQASCEKIQHYGQLRDEEKGEDLTTEEALKKIESLLGTVKSEYGTAESALKAWYLEHDPDGDEPE